MRSAPRRGGPGPATVAIGSAASWASRFDRYPNPLRRGPASLAELVPGAEAREDGAHPAVSRRTRHCGRFSFRPGPLRMVAVGDIRGNKNLGSAEEADFAHHLLDLLASGHLAELP